MRMIFAILIMIGSTQAYAQQDLLSSLGKLENIVEGAKKNPACKNYIETFWPPHPTTINSKKANETSVGVTVSVAGVVITVGDIGYSLRGDLEYINIHNGSEKKSIFAASDLQEFKIQLNQMIEITNETLSLAKKIKATTSIPQITCAAEVLKQTRDQYPN